MKGVWFNPHDVVLLLTGLLALLLAAPMLLKPRSRSSDRALAGFVLTQGLAALYLLLVYSPLTGPDLLRWLGAFELMPLVALYLLQGPLLLLYSNAITGQPVRLERADWLWLGAIMAYAVLSTVLTAAFGHRWIFPLIPMGLTLPALLLSIAYGVRALLVLRRHDRQIRERFSNIEDINLLWLSYAAVGFTGVWILRLLSFFGFKLGGQEFADLLGKAVNYPTIVLIAVMITLGLSQAQFPSSSRDEEDGPPAKPAPRINPALVEKLEHLMTEIRVYQDPDLSAEGLADSMDISPRSLSALINGHFGKNFYDFVNQHRVLEAQRRLRDPAERNTTIQRIFEDAGFNSKSTFNAFFKRATGQTPSEYRRAA
ncbi:MAG: helix-turn-helix domain-containing protein, partial [Pseudomonadota bacterium]